MNVSAKDYLVPGFFHPRGGCRDILSANIFCWRFVLLGFRTRVVSLIAPLRGCGCESSTESLILAQDERWRRA